MKLAVFINAAAVATVGIGSALACGEACPDGLCIGKQRGTSCAQAAGMLTR